MKYKFFLALLLCFVVSGAVAIFGGGFNPGNKDIEIVVKAGPIWSNDHAQERCPEIVADWLEDNPDLEIKWTGQWWTTVEGAMSVCQLRIGSGQNKRSATKIK